MKISNPFKRKDRKPQEKIEITTKEKDKILNQKYFVLKLKDKPVALLEKGDVEFKIKEIYNYDLLPFNVISPTLKKYPREDLLTAHYSQLKDNFLEWIETRQMSHERPNLDKLLKKFNIKNKSDLSTLSLNLSLFDQYWTCPQDMDINWDDVNFFANGFSSDIGDILFNPELETMNVSFISADSTTNGMDPKRWILDNDNNAYLIKTNVKNEQTQANEEIASLVCQKLEIPFIEYKIRRQNITLEYDGQKYENNLFSMSKCLCDETHTMVHATMLKMNGVGKQRNNIIDFFKNEPELREDFEKMLLLDFIMIQEDRNTNNFGFIIDNETGKKKFFFLDNANSLCYEYNTAKNLIDEIRDKSKVYETHTEALEYIDDFTIINLNKIKGIDNEIMQILDKTNLTNEQKENIIKLFNHRVKELESKIKVLQEERDDLIKRKQKILEEFGNTEILNEKPNWTVTMSKINFNPAAELEYINLRLSHKILNKYEYINHREQILRNVEYEK